MELFLKLFCTCTLFVLLSSCNSPVGPSGMNYHNKILFASSRSGIEQLYMMNPDGTDIQQLTTGPYWHAWGRWSPDTKRIVAMTGENSSTACPSEIVVFDVDGTNQRLLSCGAHVAWSPDGKKIAFSYMPRGEIGDLTTHIYVMDVDGTNPLQLTGNLGDIDDTPGWSPDGTTIAFSSSRDYPTGSLYTEIYVMHADGSDQRRLTFINSLMNGDPSWSPDGEKIAFESNGGIAIIDKDGTNFCRITDEYKIGFGGYGQPRWSPDGKRLVMIWYPADWSARTFIFTVNIDGSGLSKLLEDSTANSPDWSE